ncbi:MAG: PTS glucose transporter subunit IIA [Ruminococcus sp.]|nr:PTS glucose transporter subunit IIA [Ruminococcus sp.]
MTLFRNKTNKENSKKRIIRTCCTGEIMDISRVSNTAISSQVLGEGFCVACSDPEIVAPSSGVVEDISDNGHTFAIQCEDGVSLMLCITAKDRNETIAPYVEIGQHIEAGEVLCTKENAEAAVIVTNTDIMKNYKIAVGKAKSTTDGVIVYEL